MTLTNVEQALIELWQELLAVPRVEPHDDFLALGGHSLVAGQLANRVLDRFGVTLPLPVVYQATVLSDLAARIEELRIAGPSTTAPSPIRRARRRAVARPSNAG